MSRPDYLVIIPPHGVFSAHYTEHDAFKMVDKLRSNEANNCKFCNEKPFVVEVPQFEGICSPWRLEKPIPDPRADTGSPQERGQPDTEDLSKVMI